MQSEPYDVDPYSDVTYIQTEWDAPSSAAGSAPDDAPPPEAGVAMDAMQDGARTAGASPF